MRFKSIVVTATAPLCKTENMAVGEVSASPPRTKEKAAANRTSHVRQATAFGGKNRLRGSRRLSHETENLVLLGRSGLLVRLLRGVMLLVSLSLLRMMLGNSRVRCSSRSSVSSACRQHRSGQAQNSGHTKRRASLEPLFCLRRISSPASARSLPDGPAVFRHDRKARFAVDAEACHTVRYVLRVALPLLRWEAGRTADPQDKVLKETLSLLFSI